MFFRCLEHGCYEMKLDSVGDGKGGTPSLIHRSMPSASLISRARRDGALSKGGPRIRLFASTILEIIRMSLYREFVARSTLLFRNLVIRCFVS